jgi:hypothetical protein
MSEGLIKRIIRYGYTNFRYGPSLGKERYLYILRLVRLHMNYFLDRIWPFAKNKSEDNLVKMFWKFMEVVREEYDYKLFLLGERIH